MSVSVRNLVSTTVAERWGLVQSHSFQLRRRDGTWQKQVRETYDRGDGAAILLCDVVAGTVILTRQFRFPAEYRGENPYLIEVCAGKLEGDDAATCARKEAEEETGYRVETVEKAFDCFMSPGSVTERLSMFIGRVDHAARIAAGGGLHDEGEDIEVIELPFAAALKMVETGEIADAKTIMLLQYAAMQRLFARNRAG